MKSLQSLLLHTTLLLLVFEVPVMGWNKPQTSTQQIIKHENFPSAFVAARNVEVWLPPCYDPQLSYPVLYMHDGQNVFNPATSYAGIAWEVDSVATVLIEKRKIRPVIVVAIWNSPKRFLEYMPNKPEECIREALQAMGRSEKVLSDAYLRFIVEELKPFIDSAYSTLPGPSDTFIMGSSMGGLISMYALLEYPAVFGAAACISTHWPALQGVFVEHLLQSAPDPKKHRLYFDHGTINLDSLYHPFQLRVDAHLHSLGFVQGKNISTLKFEGADHNERAWRNRVHKSLLFLLGKEND